ncbi:MAG: hypothetical protein QM733_19460 [Ilumatobacteraceae bacterium]
MSAIQALNVVPSSAAARSIASARSGGSDTERFSRCAIFAMVALAVGQAEREPTGPVGSPGMTGAMMSSSMTGRIRRGG